MSRDRRTVYSSDGGRACPRCERAHDECVCGRADAPSAAGPVRVALEKKGRRGKSVTVVTGVPLADAELAELGRTLKQRCGAGGTVKDGTIEIQGDHRRAVAEALAALGHPPGSRGG